MTGEERAQAIERAGEALLSGVVGNAEGGADFAQGFVFKETKQYGGAIRFTEVRERVVEQRDELRPGIGRRVHDGGAAGGLLAGVAAGLAADQVDRGAAGDDVQPGDERRVMAERARAVGEVEEDGLGDVGGERFGAQRAFRDGVNEVEMPMDEFGEGFLGVADGVVVEQLGVAG
ncbi:MAG TPA: hypothetical protein VHE13_14030 [Opitutus sp.]|nr:hypothetical protein [Opitutus sp.]